MAPEDLILDGGRAPRYTKPAKLGRFCEGQWKVGGSSHLAGERCAKQARWEVRSEVVKLRCCAYHAEQAERQLNARGLSVFVVTLEDKHGLA